MRNVVIALFHRLVDRFGQVVLRYRSVIVICTQLGLITAANVTAFALRFEGDIPPDHVRPVSYTHLTLPTILRV